MGKFKFASRMENLSGSVIREILKLTQKPDIISFGGGLPSAESFPVEDLKKISEELFSQEGASMLQYGTTEGFDPLRDHLAHWLSGKGMKVQKENVLIISGSQQGIDLISKAMIDPGDYVVIESPSYLSAFQIFNTYQAKYLPIVSDGEGMVVSELETILSQGEVKPKLIYTVPTFQNPRGTTMSLERRKQLVALANKYNLVIVEDDPYGALRYEGEELPSLKALDTEGRVVYLGSFSKTVAPGLRVGYAIADPEVLSKMIIGKQGTDVHSSNLSQQMIYRFLTSGNFETHLAKICSSYKEKRDVMLKAMEDHFPAEVKWDRPEGGLFIWCELPEGYKSTELLELAVAEKVAFIPGAPFYVDKSGENTFRLNFSNASFQGIEKGISTMGRVIREFLRDK